VTVLQDITQKDQKKFSLKCLTNLQFLKSGSNHVNVTTYNLPVKGYVSRRRIFVVTPCINTHKYFIIQLMHLTFRHRAS